jgi:lipid II:glycine glycyltransferase (peptidoglycan interpeptide bridge formation enzyme)
MDETKFHAQVDGITEREWSRWLLEFEDANLYQTWSYGAIRWGAKNLSHLVLRRNGQVAGLAAVRILCPRLVKRGAAYMRWGPVCQPRGQELEEKTMGQMASALVREYVKKRRLYLRILPNALIGSPRAAMIQSAFSKYAAAPVAGRLGDRTIVLNLAPPLEQLRKGLDQKWRNQLNRAEKSNLTILEGDGLEHYQMFLRLYQDMWNRKKFDTTVDVEEFGRICHDLPEGLKMRILICQQEGAPVNGLVCSAIGNMGIYLLGATSEAGLKSKGAYLLQWAMIKWLKENGIKYYDLGGIDPERNPGVYHFKKGFSGDDVSRLAPIECCEDSLSYLCMKGAELARGGLRGLWRRAGRFWGKTSGASSTALTLTNRISK